MEVVMTTGATRRAELRVRSSPTTNQHPTAIVAVLIYVFWLIVDANKEHSSVQLFTGRMPFLSPSQQCGSTEGQSCQHN